MTTTCPNPQKRAYRNHRDAHRALCQQRSWAGVKHQKKATRAYQCRCGAFHLTTKPQHETGDAA